MRLLYITNIPSPYRIDFFNTIGKEVDLTVIFEAKRAKGIRFDWNDDSIKEFKAIFLSNEEINETEINWNIRKHLVKGAYDIIITTNYGYRTEMYAILYMQFHKIPYCIEIDGAIIKDEFLLKYWVKKRLISKASMCFSPSASTDRYYEHYGVSKKRIIRYHFTSLKQTDILSSPLSKEEKSVLRRELKMSEKPSILAIGQFIHRKGFDVLLKSLSTIEVPSALFLIGGNPTEDFIELANNTDKCEVHFLPFQTREIIKKYYMASDLFVLPTREDIWGLVINEAMANALPVISTYNCVSAVELIKSGYNGYLVPSDQDSILRERILEIIQDEDKIETMGKNSLNTIKLYTIEQMAKDHIVFFTEFLKNRR